MISTEIKNDFIIEVEPNKFLVYIDRDWGPDHTLRQDPSIALGFRSEREAIGYYHKYWTGDESRMPHAVRQRNTKIVTCLK